MVTPKCSAKAAGPQRARAVRSHLQEVPWTESSLLAAPLAGDGAPPGSSREFSVTKMSSVPMGL